MRLLVTLLLLLVLSACATRGHAPTAADVVSARAAEAFVVRHGFTAAGHAPDQPVERVELFDPLASPSELIERRRGTLQPQAIGTASRPDGSTWVLFRFTQYPADATAVVVENGVPKRLIHSYIDLNQLKWRPVAPP